MDEELRERVAMEQEQERSMQQFQAALELKRKRDREANVGAEVGRGDSLLPTDHEPVDLQAEYQAWKQRELERLKVLCDG